MHLHPNEHGIYFEGDLVPIGYKVVTPDFTFTAIYDTDGSVNSYVESGPDEPGDMTRHRSMADAKRWLDKLLQSSGR